MSDIISEKDFITDQMDSPKVITIVAGVCSSLAVFSCILMLPLLNEEVGKLERDVQGQIRQFKVTTDGLWDELILLVSRMPTLRHQRQAGPGKRRNIARVRVSIAKFLANSTTIQ